MVYGTCELGGTMTVYTGMCVVVTTVMEIVCLCEATTGLLIFLGIGRTVMHWKNPPELYTGKMEIEARDLICVLSLSKKI